MRHGRIQANLVGGVYRELRGEGCEVFASDLRVRVSSKMYAYADISIACGAKPADAFDDNLVNPAVHPGRSNASARGAL